MKRVLMIGNCNQFFRKEYVSNMAGQDVCFDILSFEKPSEESRRIYDKIITCDNPCPGKLKSVLKYICFFLKVLFLSHYDAIHIHSVKKIESVFSWIIRRKTSKLICTIYGSDFYKVNNNTRGKLKKLFCRSDYITIESTQTSNDFNEFYDNAFSDKIVNLRFGISSMEWIKNLCELRLEKNDLKRKFDIPQDSFVITVGYNAIPEQRHELIFEQLMASRTMLPHNYFIIVPLGYGNEKYAREVEKNFINSGLNGRCLFDFYDKNKIAELRYISNIMIQLQTTDLLSSSMLEYIYAENIIITGSWLPYRDIQEYIYTIDEIGELAIKLCDILSKWECIKITQSNTDYKSFIEDNFFWKNVRFKWLQLYLNP